MSDLQNFKFLIESGNLEELKNLYKKGILTREVAIEQNENLLFGYACYEGKLEICKWLYKTFKITKEEVSEYCNSPFQYAVCGGKLEVCQWLHETFYITKEEIMSDYNYTFFYACENDHYNIISFLCNTLGITEDYVKNVIKHYSEEKQEKILDCLVPLGSFSKSAK